MTRSGLVFVAACVLALPAPAAADGIVLTAATGPGDSITLTWPDGGRVTHLDPGTYTIQVSDTSELRDFTLRGPGVSEHTGFEATGTRTWTVTFQEGWYRYYDAAFENRFHGQFEVGAPPPASLNARVANTSIAFTRSDGSRVSQLDPGTYTIDVKDTSSTNNFRLIGPAVEEHTQVFPNADYTWTVTFGPGRYSFFSERHVNLHGAFTVGTATTSNARLLHGVAGPDFSIAVVDANWQPLTKAIARGAWTLSIHDETDDHDFHLVGPKVNRKTTLEFVGTATWKLTLNGGFYLFHCDPHDIMFGSFEVKSPPQKKKKQ